MFFQFSNSFKISEITGASFTGCSSLEKIVLPNEVTTIGSSAFKDCINLKTILVPSKCKTIKLHAFYNCSSLKTLLSYTLENKSEMINKESYDLIVDLSNFTEIGESCFSKCKSIVEVIYSNKKPTIEFSTFYENTSLRKIYIPSNITTIERIAFMFVKDIDIYYDGTLQQWLSIKTNITAPDVLFEGFNLYLNNELLKSITINDSIVKDEYINLSGCKSINEIILGEGEKSVMKLEACGVNNAVAMATSHLSKAQAQILMKLHTNIVVALDKDKDPKQDKNLMNLARYNNCYIMVDKENLLDEKDAPIDKGIEVFKKLYDQKERLL